ncbi:hypothetical protein FPHYL_1950 [Fusarium phyllophilum]|uniref:RRM domain-containing protein n=1 Tax=Fusarium phyllophilum TaxID=47803 RepID=A0A8H5K8Y6_9HYPO|nr:hypothetical protein FPHYL_1950 [Fusarium phyllophilum]
MDEIPNSSFDDGRLAFLGGIPLDAKKQEIAAFVHDQGFNSAVLYWPTEWLEPSGWKHQGYCIVEFSSRSEAKEAIERLQEGVFKGKRLQAAVPQRRKPSSQSLASNLPVEAKAIPIEAEAIATATKPAFESPRVEPYRGTKLYNLRELKYPEAYACSDWSKSDVRSAVIGRLLEREKEEGSPGSLVVKDNDCFHIRSRLFPSPYNDDIKDCSTVWINVTKLESGGRKVKVIDLSELPLYQENGWHEWFKGKVSTEEGTGSDRRSVSIVGDVNAPEDHKDDTF